tara:strand:- start:223 stop:612 length:390 start_codon:yes stop_codon:yes gene_type:complete
MVNAWILHVKKFAREHNKSYGCAISDPLCKSSYVKTKTPKQERQGMASNDVNAPRTRTIRVNRKESAERQSMSSNDVNAPEKRRVRVNRKESAERRSMGANDINAPEKKTIRRKKNSTQSRIITQTDSL